MVFIVLKIIFQQGDWLKFAIKKIKEVRKRKKTPIFVGGTGYILKL
jgi:tRNA dimethylallyltransferase